MANNYLLPGAENISGQVQGPVKNKNQQQQAAATDTENYRIDTGTDVGGQREANTTHQVGISKSLLDSLNPGNARFSSGISSATAHTRQVNPNELASHQLDKILAQDSPLRRRAIQQGIDQAASRGLVNSSIAGGNAFGALVDRATPLATFDASAYGTAARDNQSAQNQIGMFNAGARNERGNIITQGEIGNMADIRKAMFNIEDREDRQMSDRENMEFEAEFKRVMQLDDQAFKQSLADMDNEMKKYGIDKQARESRLNTLANLYASERSADAQVYASIGQNPKLKSGDMNYAYQNYKNSRTYPNFITYLQNMPDMPDIWDQ